MMRLREVSSEKIEKEFVFEMGPLKIPLKRTAIICLVCAIFAIAWNEGATTQLNTLQVPAYMCEEGIYVPESQNYLKCWPTQDGTTLAWECEEIPEKNKYVPSLPMNHTIS